MRYLRRITYASYLGETSPAPENIINRDFQAAVPNEKWLTDITEFQISAGKVYLSLIIDCPDGVVVSWTMGIGPDAELVNTILDAAIETVAGRTSCPEASRTWWRRACSHRNYSEIPTYLVRGRTK